MGQPEQELKNLSELTKMELKIPFYQRPYKWQEQPVRQLLDDIFECIINQEKIYRIGNIIIHNDDKGNLNIVDGQQRLTTLSILLKLLGNNDCSLLNQSYRHKISKENIIYNKYIIENWCNKITNKDKATLTTKILENCEFVLFTVFNQEEAFQLFDSQNARGKELEPYDLLKAFHLREMRFDSEEERITCVNCWEKAVDNNTLKPILANHLFKIRSWNKNEYKYNFTKRDITEFKGISLYEKQKYPFETALRILNGVVKNLQVDKIVKGQPVAHEYPFSITMPIINGKRFFEYIYYYIQQKENLLNENSGGNFNSFYKKYCFNYEGWWRSGDEKVRNLYENILLQFIDKFGQKEDFENFYKPFYKAVYLIRCNNKSIRLETILKSDARNIIREINDVISTDKLKKYQIKNYKIITTEFVKGIDLIKNFIENENR